MGGGMGGGGSYSDGGMGGSGSMPAAPAGGMDMQKLGAGLRSIGGQQGIGDRGMAPIGAMSMPWSQGPAAPSQSPAMPGGVMSMGDILQRGAKYNRRSSGDRP